jgi:hypothetical protein
LGRPGGSGRASLGAGGFERPRTIETHALGKQFRTTLAVADLSLGGASSICPRLRADEPTICPSAAAA